MAVTEKEGEGVSTSYVSLCLCACCSSPLDKASFEVLDLGISSLVASEESVRLKK